MIRRTLFGCTAAFALTLASGLACAGDAYPSKPIRFLVPYAPGGSTDTVARLFAQRLSDRLGQPIIVDNKPGASTNIAGHVLASAPPDGYTLMLATNQLVLNAVFGPAPAFDLATGMTPVALVAEMPFGIAVDARSPINSARDLVAAGRKNQLAVSHAQFEPQIKLLASALGVPVLGIPYQGGSPAVMAVLGGQTQAVLSGIAAVSPYVTSGKLRLVGVTSSRRFAAFPNVPTFAEQGFPSFTTVGWLGVVAPRGTPDPVVHRISEATTAVLKDPSFLERLRAAGAEPLDGSGAAVRELIDGDLAHWTKLAKAGVSTAQQ
jgi:tripartite-type tricarboxylate transporter receptor subunit TctC